MGVVFVLASRRPVPVPVRLLASARKPVVSSLDAADAQAGTGGPDEGDTSIVVEPATASVAHGFLLRLWRFGLALLLLILLGIGVMQGVDFIYTLRTQQARLAIAVGQQQEHLQALSFTLQALRTEFGIVTEELAGDQTPPPVPRDPAELATVALSPAETRSLTSLMEQVTTQGQQLGMLAKEIARLRSTASTPAVPSSSRYRAPAVTPSEPTPSQDPPPSYAVTLPPALGVTGFTPARPRRPRVPR
jgi:hypothetical protein